MKIVKGRSVKERQRLEALEAHIKAGGRGRVYCKRCGLTVEAINGDNTAGKLHKDGEVWCSGPYEVSLLPPQPSDQPLFDRAKVTVTRSSDNSILDRNMHAVVETLATGKTCKECGTTYYVSWELAMHTRNVRIAILCPNCGVEHHVEITEQAALLPMYNMMDVVWKAVEEALR